MICNQHSFTTDLEISDWSGLKSLDIKCWLDDDDVDAWCRDTVYWQWMFDMGIMAVTVINSNLARICPGPLSLPLTSWVLVLSRCEKSSISSNVRAMYLKLHLNIPTLTGHWSTGQCRSAWAQSGPKIKFSSGEFFYSQQINSILLDWWRIDNVTEEYVESVGSEYLENGSPVIQARKTR